MIWLPAAKPGYANTYVPLDQASSFWEAVVHALHNIDCWDKIPRVDDPACADAPGTVAGGGLLGRKTNHEVFDEGLARTAQSLGWTMEQCKQVGKLKRSHPPNRIYRVRGGIHSLSHGAPPIGVVVTYRPGVHGGPPLAAVLVLGVYEGAGSSGMPLMVPGDGLEDVTEDARANHLPELKICR